MAQSDSIATDTSGYISPPPTSIFNGSVKGHSQDDEEDEYESANSLSRSSPDLQAPTPAPDSDLPSSPTESQDAQQRQHPEPYISPSPPRTMTPGADGDIDSLYSFGHPYDDFDLRSIPSDALLPTRENSPFRTSPFPDEEELALQQEWEREETPDYVVIGDELTNRQRAFAFDEICKDTFAREESDNAVWIHLANRMKQAFKDGKNLGEIEEGEDEWEAGEDYKQSDFEEIMGRMVKAIRTGKVQHRPWMSGFYFGGSTNWPMPAERVPRNEELHPSVRMFDYDGGVVPSGRIAVKRKEKRKVRKGRKGGSGLWIEDLDTWGEKELFEEDVKYPPGRFCAEELRGEVSDDEDIDILGQSRKRRRLDDASFSESRMLEDDEGEWEEEADEDLEDEAEEDITSENEQRLAAEVEKINERLIQPDTNLAEPDSIPLPEEEDFDDPPLHALRPLVDAFIVKYERMLKQKTKKRPIDDEVFESKIRAIAIRESENFSKVLEGLWNIRKRYMHSKFGKRFIVPIYPEIPGPVNHGVKPTRSREADDLDPLVVDDDAEDELEDSAPLSEFESSEPGPIKPQTPKTLPETIKHRATRLHALDWNAVLYSATLSNAFSPAVLERAEKRCASLLGKCVTDAERNERLQKLRAAIQEPIQKLETHPYKPTLLGKRYKHPFPNDLIHGKEDVWWGQMEREIERANFGRTPEVVGELEALKRKMEVRERALFRVLEGHRDDKEEEEEDMEVDGEVEGGSDEEEDVLGVENEKIKKDEPQWKREWEDMVKGMMDDDEEAAENSSEEEVELVPDYNTHKSQLPTIALKIEAAWHEAEQFDPLGRPRFSLQAESQKWKKTEEMMRKISDEYEKENDD